MKITSCPSCGGSELRPVMLEAPVVVRCDRCGLELLESFPSDEERASYYQDEYYREGTGDRFLGPLEWGVDLFRSLRARDVLRHLPPARSKRRDALLDVGCGRGLLLDRFRALGWGVNGTQVSQTAKKACDVRLGEGTVLCGELPGLGLPSDAYRAVTYYHVLEHLDRPLEYLRETHRVLRDDGLLVIEVPDAGSLAHRWLGTRDFAFDYPHHLCFYTIASLRALLGRAGFEVVDWSRQSLEYAPYTTLQNLLNVLPGEPNRLYRALMTHGVGSRLRREPLTWLHAALAALLGPGVLLASLVGAWLGRGNTLRVYCRKAAVESSESVPAPPPRTAQEALCFPD